MKRSRWPKFGSLLPWALGSPALARLFELKPRVLVPGHDALSSDPLADLQLTRDYLRYLRQTMAAAAAELEPFEQAYARVDWSRFEHLPLFRVAHRMNAYNIYLARSGLEQQSSQGLKP